MTPYRSYRLGLSDVVDPDQVRRYGHDWNSVLFRNSS